MKRCRLIVAIIVAACFEFSLSSCSNAIYFFKNQGEFYIFKDIIECEQIYNLGYSNQEVTRYENADKDEAANGLEYTSFFGANYVSDEVSFEIFAYTFVDSSSAKSYFEKTMNRSVDSEETMSFYYSEGLFRAKLSVFNECNAYSVYLKSKDVPVCFEILSQIFSTKVGWTDPNNS